MDAFLRTRTALDESHKLAVTLYNKLEDNTSNVHLRGDMSQLKNNILKIHGSMFGLQARVGSDFVEKELVERLTEEIRILLSEMWRLKKSATHSKKYWQSEPLYHQQKNAMERVIRILSQVLDDLDGLPKFDENPKEIIMDSDHIRALRRGDLQAPRRVPLRAHEEVTWGCSPNHSDELKTKITQFSTLPIHEKLVCITAASLTIQRFTHNVRRAREERKESEYYLDGWSYVNKEELAMIGDLDGEESEYIYEESKKHPYKHACLPSLVNRYARKHVGEKLKIPGAHEYREWFHSGKPFVEDDKVPDIIPTKVEEEYYGQERTLGDKARRKVLEEGKGYVMKMEEVMKLYSNRKYRQRKY